MIPLKIQIKNFVSYGPEPQVIDFTPYNLICLSGKNGHGKSALLDALTWAIWGQARKISSMPKADDGLLRLGQTNMMVSLDFISNDVCYRVRREYSVYGKKTQALLTFGILDEETDTVKSFTEKTIKDTQDKIDTLIGLDYDTFINSAFLRQGQSNEFSKKSPKERKEILGSILGLNHYEALRKTASEKARVASQEREFTLKVCQNLEKTLAELPESEENLNKIISDLELLLAKELNIKSDIKDLKQRLEKLSVFKSELEHNRKLYEQFNSEIISYSQELKSLSNLWRQIFRQQRQTEDLQNIEKDYKAAQEKLKAIRAQSEIYLIKKDEYYKSKEELIRYSQKIRDDFQNQFDLIEKNYHERNSSVLKIDQQILEHENQIKNFKAENLILEDRLSTIRDTNNLKDKKDLSDSYIKKLEEKLISLKQSLEKRQGYYFTCSSRLSIINQEQEHLNKQLNFAENHDDPTCSFCEQKLTQEYRIKLIDGLDNRQRFLFSRKERLSKILSNLDLKINIYKQDLKESEEELKISLTLQAKIIEIEKQKAKLTDLVLEANKNLDNLNIKLNLEQEELNKINIQKQELKEKFNNTDDKKISALKDLINKLEQDLKDISYNQEKENLAILELENVQKRYDQRNNLLEQSILQEQRKKSVSNLVLKIKKLKKDREDLKLKSEKLELECSKYLELEKKLESCETTSNKLIEEKEELILKKGSLEQKLKAFGEYKKELELKKQNIIELEKTNRDYSALATAFGKDGIPALLIEDALPEIEQEANNLLAKLTDNQAQLTIESLRDLRSGGTKETLEIRISDAMGIRPYELFSGGEAFRIDFSLRIALSKLLAKRAGTTLQSLIIDEGFGSQDEEGLSHILDVLHKIQDDFAKIIIVSHLPSLKEQFPVNFYIHKTPHGSLIKVLHQG